MTLSFNMEQGGGGWGVLLHVSVCIKLAEQVIGSGGIAKTGRRQYRPSGAAVMWTTAPTASSLRRAVMWADGV